MLRLALHGGGSLSVTVLPSAIVERNGQASSLAQIASGDAVRVPGGRFVGAFCATAVIATAATASNG